MASAVTICREAVQLEQQVPKSLTSQLTALSEEACEILEAAMNAFLQGDEALASASKKRAANLSSDYDEIFRALSDEQAGRYGEQRETRHGTYFALDCAAPGLQR